MREPYTEIRGGTTLTQVSSPGMIERSGLWRWTAVAVYAGALPFTVVVWERLVAWLGSDGAAGVPWAITVVIALCATVYALYRPEPARWWVITTAAVLAALLAQIPEYPAKRIHLPSYMLMAVLVYWALFGLGERASMVRGMWVMVICTLIGVADEVVQGLLPSRFFALSDALFNAGAALVGVLLLLGLRTTTTVEDAESRKMTALKSALPGLLALGGVLAAVQSNLSQTGDGLRTLSSPMIGLLFLVALAAAISSARLRAPAAGIATAIVSTAALGLLTAGVLLRVPFQ